MYYIIEKIFIKTQTNPDKWSDSKRVVCINSVFWKIERFFKKIVSRYKATNNFEEFRIEDDYAEFYISDNVSVRYYITQNDLYEPFDW